MILGGSFGAGNYALCGKAFDPRFIFAWPTARYAVMGGEQAASTLLDITVSALKRAGHEPDAAELEELRDKVEASYEEQTDVRYARRPAVGGRSSTRPRRGRRCCWRWRCATRTTTAGSSGRGCCRSDASLRFRPGLSLTGETIAGDSGPVLNLMFMEQSRKCEHQQLGFAERLFHLHEANDLVRSQHPGSNV